MMIDVGPVSVFLDEADDRICSHVLDGSGFEPASRNVWASIVQRGKTAIDIGAYSGLYAIAAAKLGAKVVAIEPMPKQQVRIASNATANGVVLTLLCCAASDRRGAATLWHNPKVPLTTGASFIKDKAVHRDSIEVGCILVDALALENVAAIKIDVERHETSVIRGAIDTIERDRPVLLVETLDDKAREQVLELLPSYKIGAVLDQRNTLFIPKGEQHAAGTVRRHGVFEG